MVTPLINLIFFSGHMLAPLSKSEKKIVAPGSEMFLYIERWTHPCTMHEMHVLSIDLQQLAQRWANWALDSAP
jgi:hypothetical protein